MSDIAILMSIRNKKNILGNTLLSLKNQIGTQDYKLCIFDDASSDNPLPFIQEFIDAQKIIYKRAEVPITFEKTTKQFLDMIPQETKYIFFQSSDVIWRSPTILSNAVQTLMKKGGVVSPEILNFQVDNNLWMKPINNFYSTLDANAKDMNLRCEKKNPKYAFLAAMTIDIFRRANQYDYYCDLIFKNYVLKNKIPFILIKETAIHQCHPYVVYECSSLNICKHTCATRRKYKRMGVAMPKTLGTYNARVKRWQ